MKFILKTLLLGALLLAPLAQAAPIQGPNGNYYERINTRLLWTDARDAAALMSFESKSGHLATILDAATQNFIFLELGVGAPGDCWFGGTDEVVEGEWRWVTGELFWLGTAAGSVQSGLYENWNGGEPNNAGDEDGLEMNGNGSWNDEENGLLNECYFVEYVEPQDFKINAGLNDAWYNPLTDGQGFFVTVFPDLKKVFLAWFTFDTEPPPMSATANLGYEGHRWLTAIGSYVDNEVVMNISITTDGIFDNGAEVQNTDPPGSDGTIILTFDNCNSATVEYDIASINRQGIVPIQRIANDNIVICEALSAE